MSGPDIVERLPYPKNIEDAATLAVESCFQQMGEAGAFDESGGLSKSAMIFGKACAYTALKELLDASMREALPTVSDTITALRKENAELREAIDKGAYTADRISNAIHDTPDTVLVEAVDNIAVRLRQALKEPPQ